MQDFNLYFYPVVLLYCEYFFPVFARQTFTSQYLSKYLLWVVSIRQKLSVELQLLCLNSVFLFWSLHFVPVVLRIYLVSELLRFKGASRGEVTGSDPVTWPWTLTWAGVPLHRWRLSKQLGNKSPDGHTAVISCQPTSHLWFL